MADNRSIDTKRLLFITLGALFLFSLLIIKFYYLQVVDYEYWAARARAQHQIEVREPFMRGTFYANTDLKLGHPSAEQPLVIDIKKYHLYIDPHSIPQKHKRVIADALLQIVTVPEEGKERFYGHFEKKSRSRNLKKWLSRKEREQIMEWWQEYRREHRLVRNAIYFVSDYQRSYPFGSLLGQVMHTIREVRDEKTQQGIPTGGMELSCQEYLKGEQGKRLLWRSPRSPFEKGNIIEEPINGADVYLTINHYLQSIAEEELESAVHRLKAKHAWAVMMDPFSGEILALAQYPSFDPANYRHYYNDTERLEQTKVMAVTNAYEPGSTMKPLTLAVCLQANKERQERGEEPLFSPQEKIDTSSGMFPGRSHPLEDLHPANYLNMYMALQKSSNIYHAEVVDRLVESMGNAWYRDALIHFFSFGTKTGIELPSEAFGKVPTPGKVHPNGTLEWSKSTPYSLAIGHNVMATSIQMARAYAILANGGYEVTPTLIRKVVRTHRNGEEEVLVDHTGRGPGHPYKRIFSSDVVEEVVRALRYVTSQRYSGGRANVPGYTEAGKTGTANKIVNGSYSKKKYFSSFVGFVPVAYPKFVLYIGVDEPSVDYYPGQGYAYYGSTAAAPLFREIASKSLAYMGVPYDDPYGMSRGDPRYDPRQAKWQQEVKELSELYRAWNEE